MSDKIYDPSFEINSQAFAVAAYLDADPEFAEYKNNEYLVRFVSKPWYNGRERGIVISMCPEISLSKHILHIAFFEHRNSDQICCLKWETNKMYWNHPLEDRNIFKKTYLNDDKYDVEIAFAYGEAAKCAKWIYNEFEKFYNEYHKITKGK